MLRPCLLAFTFLLGSFGFSLAADKDAILALAKDLKAKDAKKRAKAAEDLGKVGADAKIVSKELCNAILDPNPKVSLAAFTAIEQVRPDLYKPLSKVILDNSRDKQDEGMRELGKLGEEARPAAPMLCTVLTQMVAEDVSKKRVVQKRATGVYEALVAIGSEDVEVTKQMKAIAASVHSGHSLNATAYLVAWAGEDESRRKEVIPFIKTGLETPGTHPVYIPFAVSYGALAKDCVPSLKKLKLSTAESVRNDATKAIESIEAAVAAEKK